MKFEQRFKEIQEQEGFSIAKVCRLANIERTLFQKLTKGQRHPPTELLARFLQQTTLSVSQKKELLHLYEIERVGERRFYARQYVATLFQQLGQLAESASHEQSATHLPTKPPLHLPDIHIVSGQLQTDLFLEQWILDALSNQQTLQVFLPFAQKNFFDHLRRICLANHTHLSMNHILAFEKDGERKPTINLEILSEALRFASISPSGYRPRLFYCNTDTPVDAYIPMPYYCATESSVILFDAHGDKVIYCKNKPFLQSYRDHFTSTFAEANALIQPADTSISALESYISCIHQRGDLLVSYEEEPCFARYITADLVEKYIVDALPNRPQVVAAICSLYENMGSSTDCTQSFFSERGLYDFTVSGVISYFPKGLCRPLEFEDRLLFLQSIRDDVAQQNAAFYIVKKEEMYLSPNMIVEAFSDNTVLFVEQNVNGIHTTILQETSIYDNILDFFQHLAQSNGIHSRESTLSILDGCIDIVNRLKQS